MAPCYVAFVAKCTEPGDSTMELMDFTKTVKDYNQDSVICRATSLSWQTEPPRSAEVNRQLAIPRCSPSHSWTT